MIKKDFELPIVHIHQDTMPTLDHNKDTFEYSIQFIVQRHQEQINDEIMKNIQALMKEKGISEYYGIDEKRLLEIVEEAKAFEIITKKNVNIGLIKDKDCTLEIYNTMMLLKEWQLTEEEYDILNRRL